MRCRPTRACNVPTAFGFRPPTRQVASPTRASMTLNESAALFREAARRYCATIDAATTLERDAFLDRVAPSLIELHQHALALPDVEGSDDIAADAMGHEQSSALFLRLSQLLGEYERHWLVHDPTDTLDHQP